MTAPVPANDFRELQRAIAHAAVDRLLARPMSIAEVNSMTDQQKGEGLANRDPATPADEPGLAPHTAGEEDEGPTTGAVR